MEVEKTRFPGNPQDAAAHDFPHKMLRAPVPAMSLPSTRTGGWDWDLATGTFVPSASSMAVLGYAPEEVSLEKGGLLDWWRRRIEPVDLPAWHAAVEAIPRSGEARWREHEYRLRDRSGATLWVLERAGAVSDGRLAAVWTDITSQKQRELSLGNELLHMKARLGEATRELEHLIYAVSHDLSAPLRAINGFSSAILEDCTDDLPPKGKDYLQRIRSNGERMATMIDCVRELSRTALTEVRFGCVDISALAAECAARQSEKNKGRVVECFIQPGLRAWGDRALLQRALEHLFDNAWKFTSARPAARVSLEKVPPRDDEAARLSSARRSPATVFCLRDNGAGFDPRYSDRLFKVFQRLHPPAEFPGIGFGLADVSRIISRHGGKAWAEGAIGEGASIYFTLHEYEVEGLAAKDQYHGNIRPEFPYDDSFSRCERGPGAGAQ